MRKANKTGLVCDKCPQFSRGTCLVFSVNIYKYGMPKECKKI